jgi:tetratricopeptide (TPR) repeat protein/predicted Ser/Thr protein kinase
MPEQPPSGSEPTLGVGTASPGAADSRALEATAWGDTMARSSGAGSSSPSLELGEVAERIGRYLVLGRLGAGGMGVVYAAFDPELDRKVAIKLIRGRPDAEAQARLLREAQAMARLSHPNVVACYDVGTFQGQIFIAMEFVRGETLGAWMKRGPRSWREVLAVFLPAGRGLAAAHDAGLVHRDFKPDNVLVDSEGRARVTDFGLARAADSVELAAAVSRPAMHELEVSGALAAPLTRHGAILGTPAYMAREQHLGLVADARTDQFAFCASLYQALHGQLPFAGRTVLELAENVLEGRIDEPPRARKVPLFLQRAVLRGLSREPAQRWPDMHHLLRALGRDPARTRRRVVAGGLLLALGAGGAAALLAGPEPCSGGEAQLASVWDETRAQAVESALRATGVAYADETWSRVHGAIDQYAATWSTMHEQTCRAHRRGELSSELLDLEMACLDARRGELAALVDVLTAADASVAERAVQAAAGLPRLDLCADGRALRTGIPAPTATQEPAVARVRAQLARARAEGAAGRYVAAAGLAEAALAEARTIDHRPLVGEALLRSSMLGKLAGGAPAEAEAALTEAWRVGLATRDDEVAAESAVEQIAVVGRELARFADGERWAADALALLERRGRDDTLAARYHLNLGNLFLRADRLDRAVATLERAVQLREAALGAAHPDVAAARTALGEALRRQGRFAEAAAAHEQALRDTIAAFGPGHPQVAVARNNLGIAYGWLGRHADAVAEHEAAIALRERALGPDHPQLASSRSNLASELLELGRLAEAETELRRAIEILQRRDPRHPDLAGAQTNLGNFYFARGRHADALAAYSAALASDTALLGEDAIDAAITRNNVGTSLWQLGRLADAERELRRSLTALEAGLGPDHPHVAFPLLGLGSVLLDEGRPAEAVALLSRAADLAQKQDSPGFKATARSELAQARLRALGRSAGAGERAEARREVEAALVDIRREGPLFEYARIRADAFLAATP